MVLEFEAAKQSVGFCKVKCNALIECGWLVYSSDTCNRPTCCGRYSNYVLSLMSGYNKSIKSY